MTRKITLGALAVAVGWLSMSTACAKSESKSQDSINVELQNAGRTLTYKAATIVDGETITLKNQTLTATESNQIVLLVANGGKVVLDHCTIVKKGDGKSSGRGQGGPGGGPGGKGQRNGQGGGPGGQGGPGGMVAPAEGPGGMGPCGAANRPPIPPTENASASLRRPMGRPGQGGPGGMPGMGGPGGGGGDDGFNFYGTNSAVVALGKGSTIEMIGCTVQTDAEYANAVFAADEAVITISDGISIDTQKGSSRGLFATTKGVITATGTVCINTKGAHCAALATDRGGGTVTVGTPDAHEISELNTGGEGSPCIYSTGDISAYNCTGVAGVSQTMVIEGKNSITIGGCSFVGNSPKHGGIMLYQSMSGDAEEGTSVLNMSNSTIRDNTGTAMILVTNTHTVVNMERCRLLDKDGNAVGSDYPLVTARNCNSDGRQWGREGSNGGQIELNLKNQSLAGTLLANETESRITVTADAASDTSQLKTAEGKGQVTMK